MTTEEFIQLHREEDIRELALLAGREKEVDRIYALQQIEGWQKACTKLPEISRIEGWIFPPRISMEQCSGELTAKYKHEVINSSYAAYKRSKGAANAEGKIDLTGGFGIDAYYMGATDYVEQSEELCRIAAHNFALAGRSIHVHNTTSETYLAALTHANLIYIDPARRDSHGGKVFRLEDCTPNVAALYPTLMSKCDRLMLKLSPMLDITDALRHLPDAREVHVVAVRNEVKEVLVVCERTMDRCAADPQTTATSVCTICVNLDSPDPVFSIPPIVPISSIASIPPLALSSSAAFWMEKHPEWLFRRDEGTGERGFLYEPNAAIMKAGLYVEVGARYGLQKLAENSHLYTSGEVIADFPGRIWQVHEATKDELKNLKQANILCRNYPLKPEEVKKKYKLKDGGETYLIGSRIGTRPILLLGERIR